MRHLVVVVVVFFFFAIIVGHANEPATGQSAVLGCGWPSSTVLDSIVAIESGSSSHASGVVVSSNLVITAAHVLEDYDDTEVMIRDVLYPASVLLVDRESDIALLSVWTENLFPIPLSKFELYESQEVWAAGYPRAQNLHTSSGNFVAKKAEAIHTSAGIDSGESGGGLLTCENGEFVLAGMLRGYGAYRTEQGLVRIKDYSISVAASDIKFTLDLSYNAF